MWKVRREIVLLLMQRRGRAELMSGASRRRWHRTRATAAWTDVDADADADADAVVHRAASRRSYRAGQQQHATLAIL